MPPFLLSTPPVLIQFLTEPDDISATIPPANPTVEYTLPLFTQFSILLYVPPTIPATFLFPVIFPKFCEFLITVVLA